MIPLSCMVNTLLLPCRHIETAHHFKTSLSGLPGRAFIQTSLAMAALISHVLLAAHIYCKGKPSPKASSLRMYSTERGAQQPAHVIHVTRRKEAWSSVLVIFSSSLPLPFSPSLATHQYGNRKPFLAPMTTQWCHHINAHSRVRAGGKTH